MAEKKQAYKALVGLDYNDTQRAEIGDVVDDLPPKSVVWLLRDGLIETVEE